MKRVARSFLAVASVLSTLAVAGCSSDTDTAASGGAAETVSDRPRQKVLLAFDGSLNLDFWQESRAFAAATPTSTDVAQGKHLTFTYFISGPYFMADANKKQYTAPHHSAGQSDIGFGGTADSIPLRYKQVETARSEGHEMASHANGHYDGTAWTAADWENEFTQFDKIIFQGTGYAPNLDFTTHDLAGFRAPLLGHGPGLYTTLAAHGFKYDTSKTAATNYWPQQQSGIWNFPLAEVRIVGSGKKTLSMDYNFYYTQSKGLPDAAHAATYQKEMLDTYMQYFESNYFGNRAPVSIGHHFSKWNGGAYWAAMQAFAKRVCGLPEVDCVTYSELLSFVEENKAKLADFQAGRFTKMTRPPSSDDAEPMAPFTDEERNEVLQAREQHDNDDE